MYLSSLTLYPLKSGGGISVPGWEVGELGLRYDRRWMAVTPPGEFITQREQPRLALIRPEVRPPHLVLRAPGQTDLVTALEPLGGRPIATRVWDNPLAVVAPDHRADAWLSEALQQECMLAYFPATLVREVDRWYAPRGGRASFADGFPFLLIGENSLAELNSRLAHPLPMNRFRPNLVVQGSAPFAEDGWQRIRVGAIPMEVVKSCARCVVTTTDQATGRRDGDEPLRTLAGFRRVDGQVMFGMNVVHYGTGELRVGDPILVE
jgi:uncharacterized protein YcbX